MTRDFLLIHGMCCTGEVWSNFRKFYEARGIAVHTPTLRPLERVRRKPPKTLRALRFAHYVDDIEQEIDRIAQQRGSLPTVIGHSMGGLIGQVIAERNRASAVVLISPTAPVDVRDRQLSSFWRGFAIARSLGLVPSALFPYRLVTDYMVFNQVPLERRDAEHAGMVLESREVFADFAMHAIDASKIRIPLLTISARRDRLVPAKIVRMTAKKYEACGGDFKEYKHHGHWLYAEPGWEEVAADILTWVEGRASSV